MLDAVSHAGGIDIDTLQRHPALFRFFVRLQELAPSPDVPRPEDVVEELDPGKDEEGRRSLAEVPAQRHRLAEILRDVHAEGQLAALVLGIEQLLQAGGVPRTLR